MICDRISALWRYKGISANLDKAIDWLMREDLSGKKAGVYEIEGRDVYYMIQDTALRTFRGMLDEGRAPWEAHRAYVDIQAPITRSEYIAVAPLDELDKWEEFREKDDIVFSSCPKEGSRILLAPGDAAILFPGDAHCPCLEADGSGRTLKIVMKVRVG